MRWATLVFVLGGLLYGCARGRPEPQTLRLEDCVVRLVPPDGWEHVDYGREHQFRRGRARLTLELMNQYPYPPQVEVILARLGHDEQRSIASMQNVVVDGRKSLVVETWDHLSHRMPMRVALIPYGDRQLVLHTRNGDYERSLDAFDKVLAGLDIIEPESLASSPGEGR